VKADESGGIPLYVQGNLNGDAVTWTNLARFGAYTANSNEFEVYGDINATEDIRASTGFFDTNSAGDPGGTGLFMAYAGSDPDSGPAIRWTDGTLGNTIGLYISGGLNWQGDVGGNPDFNVLQPTDTGALGTIRVHLDGDAAGDSYFNGGNVGIGTTTPAGGKLNVVGDGNFTGKVYFGELATNVLSLIEPIYIRGTGLNNNANRVLKISNTTIYDTTGRGLRLTVLWKANHSIVSDTTYDTYGLGTASDSLAADMNGMTNAQMGILTSNDAWENNVTANLDTAFGRKGLYKAQISPNSGSRRPYAAIFESASNNETSDKAAECLYDDTTNQSYCEIRGFLIDGSFTATGTTKNALTNTQGNLLAVVADENANVGIGTTSPQQKLNVVGTANFTGNTTSLTDFCIVGGNCLSTSGGTMSSFTLGASAGANQTINDGNTAFLVAGTGITTTAAATDMVTIAATLGTAIEKGELANSGTLSFDWVDSEVDDALTISGGTIGTNTISSGAAWNTAGTLTIGDAGDRIDISSSGWDVINSALSGATISGNTIALSTNTYTGTLGGANITADSIGDTQLAFNTGQHLTTASSPTFGGLTLNGNLNLSGKNITNVDHIDANSYDPPYTIAGERYATFLPGMSGGVKEEVTGTIMLNSNYVIDFKKLERGSDLWLFYQVTDFGEKMENLQVILTPSFDGRVWYTKDPVKKTITIHGSHSGEVSYRLTSNRYDWKSLVNYKPVSPGHIIPEEK
ncbi:MAG: hypothetical protein Q8P79_03530, partial [Nanoarchaeota archaeon]|nr:hypothetical protein [Nanoarchaeota archaeon]